MENNKYLNEKNYERGKNKLFTAALIVLIVGLLIGGSLIAIGVMRTSKTNAKYSNNKRTDIQNQITTEKQNLENKKKLLEEKIQPTLDEITKLERVSFDGLNEAYYARQDKIKELRKSIEVDERAIEIIGEVTEDGFDTCSDVEINYSYTKKYCSLKIQFEDLNSGIDKIFESSKSIPFFVIGVFIIIFSCMIFGYIYIFAKRREITAFVVQQTMPIAQEGISTMAPTMGEAAGEIAKGIKHGLNDDKKDK